MIVPFINSVNGVGCCGTEADGARALIGPLFCLSSGVRAKNNIEFDI